MSDKDYPDWETLNAYVDGELSSEQEAWVKNCCKDNPNITSEIARLVILKKALASQPEAEKRSSWVGESGKWKVAGGAGVLALTLVLFLTMSLLGGYGPSSFQSWAYENHENLSDRSFVVTDLQHTPIIAASVSGSVQAPDLTGSKLYLVDLSIKPFGDNDGIVMHYRGLRGCRVSFLLVPMKGEQESSSETRVAQEKVISDFWVGKRFRFGLMATGMDESRFKSISSFLKQQGEKNLPTTVEEQHAMREVYETSNSCV